MEIRVRKFNHCFRDIKTLQKFSAVHASIYTHFNHQPISTIATYSNKPKPLRWPSGINLQPKSPHL